MILIQYNDDQALTTCGAFSQRIRPRIIFSCVKFFETFATKVPHLTFCDKIGQLFTWDLIEREEKKRKCRE